MLNIIWVGFFIVAFVIALVKLLFLGEQQVFSEIMGAMFTVSKMAFEISLGLTGVLALWLGIMRIGEESGLIRLLTYGLTPLFKRLMPEIPDNHPALGAMVMNISANALGLDNAATPLGIKAMKELQSLNPTPDTASNAQILFLVINTSAVTLFPITIFSYRSQLGASNPADVFIPILITTYLSTLAGILSVAFVQKINLLDKVIFSYMFGFSVIIGLTVFYFSQLSQSEMLLQSALLSNIVLFSLVVAFLVAASIRGVNAYEAFIVGAKEGFNTAIIIIPYLVAMLVGIAVFRASGALDLCTDGLRYAVALLGMDTQFIDAMPTAFMKPFSGSGARAMMVDTMETYGADSFAGRLASVLQGSTETTFYILSVYFGAVGIKNIRHAVACGLTADIIGIIAAILISYWFFA